MSDSADPTDMATLGITGLLHPLRPLHASGSWRLIEPRSLSISAGPMTDWFIDPDGGPAVENAPALVMPTTGSWTLSAEVSAAHAATYDAAVLVVHQGARSWAKLCLERSPKGAVMIVSVVTRESSDDCNSVPIDRPTVHLRIARLAQAYAFHYSLDGTYWELVRYFSLGAHDHPAAGFLAQSPTGLGCTAEFRDIRFSPHGLGDVRSGV